MATDADQGAEAWPCRRQASAATGRAHGATEQQGRAFVALAHVVADAGGGGWPEQHDSAICKACRTPQERNAWAQKWGGYLSGQVEREKRGAPERPPPRGRDAGGACQPS